MRQDRASRSELMARAAAGDAGAFGQLAAAVQDALFRFALAHGLARADAAEAVQETLLRAYRRRHAWQAGRSVDPWLYGIAMNVVREFRRRRRRAAASGIDLDIVAAAGAANAGAEEHADLARLAAAIAGLPDRQREALTCRHLRQMSVRETAEAMGCAEGTVKAAVAAALENLRTHLRPNR